MTLVQVTDTMSAPLAGAELLKKQIPTAIGVVALAAVLGDDEGLVLCPFRRTTGGYCPLCGGTRAASSLIRGDVAGTWSLHPLVLLLALQIPVILWMSFSTRLEATRRTWIQRLLVANLVAATAIWVIRLATGDLAPPTDLAWPL